MISGGGLDDVDFMKKKEPIPLMQHRYKTRQALQDVAVPKDVAFLILL